MDAVAPRALRRLEDIPDGGARGFTLDGPGAVRAASRCAGGTMSGSTSRGSMSTSAGTPLDRAPDTFLDPGGTGIMCATRGAPLRINDGVCGGGARKGDHVRFFRMAERRIAEKTGQGVTCFISSHSWLDGLSFTGMRERYLEAFDTIRIDCLNGDKYKTGTFAPDGSPGPSIFSTEGGPLGIQVGAAVTTLVRKAEHKSAGSVGFRHLWGQAKRADLLETAETSSDALYEPVEPVLPPGLPFAETAGSADRFG